jgi:signal transduction histidine kinase
VSQDREPVAGWRRRLGARNVRIRITVAATLAAAIAALAGSVLFVGLLQKSLEQALVSSASQQLQTVKAQLARGSSPEQAVVSGRDDVITQIVSADGRVVASDHPKVTRPLRTTPGVWRDVHIAGLHDDYSVVARRAPSNDLLVVGRSEEQVDRATGTATTLLAVSVPIGLALLALVVWVSTGRALRPVEEMRREASAITSEHLHRRLHSAGGTDELSRLARTLNEMLDRIDAAQRLQRQFVSDASHELRSPLAAMRQVTEVAQRYPDRADAGQLAADVLLEEQRMEQLVTALLTLARLDDRVSAGSPHVVDVDEIVVAEMSRIRGTGPRVPIESTKLDAAQVRGHEVLLVQVVHNLLSNAVRHARSGVLVTLEETGGRVRLLVDDDGNGVAPEQRDLIFDRFVRLDEARNRDAGGTGLGLAIVRKVVEGLGGTVTVADSPSGGARFAVSLPSWTEREPT